MRVCKGCGKTDALHATLLLIEKLLENKLPIHIFFLELEKAFDRVSLDLIWFALRSHCTLETTYLGCIQLLYKGASSAVRCAAGDTSSFEIHIGVHHGSALLSLLFILCIDIIGKSPEKTTSADFPL